MVAKQHFEVGSSKNIQQAGKHQHGEMYAANSKNYRKVGNSVRDFRLCMRLWLWLFFRFAKGWRAKHTWWWCIEIREFAFDWRKLADMFHCLLLFLPSRFFRKIEPVGCYFYCQTYREFTGSGIWLDSNCLIGYNRPSWWHIVRVAIE